MIDEMNVTFVFAEPTYETFSGAIRASAASKRTARAKHDNATTMQTGIVAYAVEAAEVSLQLADDHMLRVYCRGDEVEWELTQAVALTQSPKIYADSVALKLPDANEIQWRPKALLQARLNRRGIGLAPTHTLLFLSVPGLPDLMFAQMASRDGARFLFFEEE